MTIMAESPLNHFMNRLYSFVKRFLFQLVIVIIVLQVALAASWAWTWFLFWHDTFSGILLKAAVVSGSALITGVLTRVFLQGHLRLLRWLSALTSMMVSLVGMSFVSQNRVGFQLELTNAARPVNWDGIWQILLAGGITWLAVYAWSWISQPSSAGDEIHPATTETPEPPRVIQDTIARARPLTIRQAQNQGITRNDSTGRSNTTRQTLTGQTGFQSQTKRLWSFLSTFWSQINQPRFSNPAGHDPAPALPVRQPVTEENPKPRPARSKKRKTSPGNAIRLIGQEEHRCPYCLELVNENDPAGVVICPVCHAYHHKNCWDITGTCQVPHIQK